MTSSITTIQKGIPTGDFFPKAWASEPLTDKLKGTNIPFALPSSDPDVSLVAKEGDQVIGQCSANRVVKYWSHLDSVDLEGQNLSTRIFVAIHKKAVQVERAHLAEIKEPEEKALHSAGIAVLPEYRGRRLGLDMRARQIALCQELGMTALFCETTNRYSAETVRQFGFTQLAQYPYEALADELGHSDLSTLKDSFTVWCRRL